MSKRTDEIIARAFVAIRADHHRIIADPDKSPEANRLFTLMDELEIAYPGAIKIVTAKDLAS